MEPTETETRDALIAYEVVDQKRALQDVANDWDISRERVRQIVKEQRPEFSAFDRRIAYRAAIARKYHEESIARREEMRTSLDTTRAGLNQVFTKDDLLRILREVTETQGPMTTKKWDSLPPSNEIPCVALYIIRFGSWNNAKALAGLPEIKPNRSYTRLFEDMDLIDSVAEFLRTASSEDGWFGAQHYERWRKSHEDPSFHPSLALLRMRLGKWNDIKAVAIQRNQEQS